MMPSDAVLAALCASIYGITAPVGFEHFDPGNDDGVCWALKRLPGFDVVVFRGDQRHSYENPGMKTAVGYSAVLLTPLLP